MITLLALRGTHNLRHHADPRVQMSGRGGVCFAVVADIVLAHIIAITWFI